LKFIIIEAGRSPIVKRRLEKKDIDLGAGTGDSKSGLSSGLGCNTAARSLSADQAASAGWRRSGNWLMKHVGFWSQWPNLIRYVEGATRCGADRSRSAGRAG
jgi:hypothetical protein